jgi:hypothetical protein
MAIFEAAEAKLIGDTRWDTDDQKKKYKLRRRGLHSLIAIESYSLQQDFQS